MPWTGVAVALLIALVALVVGASLSAPGPVEVGPKGKPGDKGGKPDDKEGDRPERMPGEKLRPSMPEVPRVNQDEDEGDTDITIVTLGPLAGALPQLPRSAF